MSVSQKQTCLKEQCSKVQTDALISDPSIVLTGFWSLCCCCITVVAFLIVATVAAPQLKLHGLALREALAQMWIT